MPPRKPTYSTGTYTLAGASTSASTSSSSKLTQEQKLKRLRDNQTASYAHDSKSRSLKKPKLEPAADQQDVKPTRAAMIANSSSSSSSSFHHQHASSSNAVVAASTSSSATKVKSEDTKPNRFQEKRLKRFRSSCPKKLAERVDRVYAQRFFCVDRNKLSETSENFGVLGSTGNVYVITIDSQPSCTCPDHVKNRDHCKHILFVMLKVLQVPHDSGLWYQSALLHDELVEIFANARPAPQDEQTKRARAVYRKVTGQATKEEDEAGVKKRIPEDGDACPVCYEDYEAGDTKGLVFCGSCGNGLHKVCFQSWAKQQDTCVMCRAKWIDADAPAGGGATAVGTSREGYVNLGASLNISPERDTSTYHQPWLRGTEYYGGGRRGGRGGRGRASHFTGYGHGDWLDIDGEQDYYY